MVCFGFQAAQRDKAEAAAQAFKSARVVGTTVAGAARRLEALRAAQPFAVVSFPKIRDYEKKKPFCFFVFLFFFLCVFFFLIEVCFIVGIFRPI